MIDLTTEMAELWAALGPGRRHRGRVVLFVSALAGEGTSTVAREYARLAAVRARKPVWLIDGDLVQQDQMQTVGGDPERFGQLGRPAHASPDGSSFFTISPPLVGRGGQPVAPARLITARPALGGRLWVTRFNQEILRSGQRAEATDDSRYWDALRAHAETIVIDAPSADRSDLALVLAPLADLTVLVVAGQATDAAAPMALRDEIEAVGGTIAGVVVNRSTYRAPPLLRRLTA
jgi:Mrp family chromosome partitioning ATPase